MAGTKLVTEIEFQKALKNYESAITQYKRLVSGIEESPFIPDAMYEAERFSSRIDRKKIAISTLLSNSPAAKREEWCDLYEQHSNRQTELDRERDQIEEKYEAIGALVLAELLKKLPTGIFLNTSDLENLTRYHKSRAKKVLSSGVYELFKDTFELMRPTATDAIEKNNSEAYYACGKVLEIMEEIFNDSNLLDYLDTNARKMARRARSLYRAVDAAKTPRTKLNKILKVLEVFGSMY